MIRVDRSKVSPPATLDGIDSIGGKETIKNRALASNGRHKDMSFAAYASQPVKHGIGILFHRKCAYCESLILGNQPGDVEHYRPKKKVRIEISSGKIDEVPGYYWMAADWANLLLSCIDCNRARKQEMATGGVELKGKANWFPLEDETARAIDEGGIANEKPLLLNPCEDNPEDYLYFDRDGAIHAIDDCAKGKTTIEVCGLDRLELLQARAMQRVTVAGLLRHIKNALSERRDPDQRDIDDLISLMSPGYPFNAYVKHLVRSELLNISGIESLIV